ncbi:ORF84 [Betabaculovirus altermyunipunctae]|uniref:ORF84 n=1 Tax=Betabaculovirus altermyunipunctae TaxID=3051996 RepID=A0A1S5YDZ5_9BBAC|nr:ORF84 [Betabaculovirus altermyunipunctae]AQQ80351.1 ORF84 [Betabaculovirus altermyunipunctae]
MMPKGRSCAYYKCLIANYLSVNERVLWSVTVQSLRRFIKYSGESAQFPVYVTFDDWTNHPCLQALLIKCYRLRRLDVYLLYWRNTSIIVTDSVKRCVNENDDLWSELFDVWNFDEAQAIDSKELFMQNNCVPSLFLTLERISSADEIDHTVLQILETYSYEEIAQLLSRYCTKENFNQLVNVCTNVQKHEAGGACASWHRFVELKAALNKLGILHRVQLRPDNDYKFLKQVCGRTNTNG